MTIKTFRRPRGVEPRATISPAGTVSAAVPRNRRRWLIALGVIVAILALIQVVGSPIAGSLVNRRLSELDGYVGHAGGVSLALWRGAVDLNDFVLKEKSHPDDLPVVRIRHASLRLAPGALLTGKLGGAAVVDDMELNLVKRERTSPEEVAEKAAKIEEKKEQVQRWQDALRNSFPVTLSRMEVRNGQFRFLDRSHQPVPEIRISELHIVARDLQNRPKANGDPMPTKVQVDGTMSGNGKLRATLQVDPIARQPRFVTRFELRELSLPPINPFLQAYADADVSRGSFELYLEAEAKDGGYQGYVKPLFHDLDFRTASDANKNTVEKLKEKLVSAVASVLKNDEKEQVATRAPFNGNFADNRVDIWTTVAELFRNAFVQALRSGFERPGLRANDYRGGESG